MITPSSMSAEERIANARKNPSLLLDLSGLGLTNLPASLADLSELKCLDLSSNGLTMVPDWLGRLAQLRLLYLNHNRLADLPDSMSNLTQLQVLSLSDNQLTAIPDWLVALTQLSRLNLDANQLREIPDPLGNMSQLKHLRLRGNRLVALPDSLSNLGGLRMLDISDNELTALDEWLLQLWHSGRLEFRGNPISSPPPEVMAQGYSAALAFARARSKGGRRQWVSKLILVGEGAVGKSELLRSLRGDEFAGNLETTHGIEVRQLDLPHPTEKDVRMSLNCWDFGGQEIYHATHQFFLTQRSLFLLVWSARLGWEPCKLYYWLDAIKARAPDAQILIVATWTDERSPDLPLADIMRAYPQVRSHFAVSNKRRTGIEELQVALADAAARLPLMGAEWPASWLSAAEALRARQEKYVQPRELRSLLSHHGVDTGSQTMLGRVLHDLGDILWFQDDLELDDIVVLKPQWVTEYISRVLESPDIISRRGVFTRPHMNQLWDDLQPEMRDHFLRLMERFDLSYRTLDPQNQEISLVVERLPFDPAEYVEDWQKSLAQQCTRTITMRYRLNTIPAGIPTWFIARSHRFTTHKHWRSGAMFADGKARRHLALVRCDVHQRTIELSARGPMPHNFFALLRDGFELTLARFPGLEVTRYMPCPGHDGQPCNHEFRYKDLEGRLARTPPVDRIECPVAATNESITDATVSVPRLVLGLSWRVTGTIVLDRMDELQREIETHVDARANELLGKLGELQALTQRQFLTLFQVAQKNPDSCCPNVFTLTGDGRTRQLRFLCQAPGQWHGVKDAGCYEIDVEPEILRTLRPYASRLLAILKTIATLARPATGIVFPQFGALRSNEIELMAETVKAIPVVETEDIESALVGSIEPRSIAEPEDNPAALRAIRRLLDLKDPDRTHLGLKLVPTPEGHYMWLCEHHAKEYAPGHGTRE